jgi:hypothetical protein
MVFNEGPLPHRLGLLRLKTLMTFSTLNVHRLSRNVGTALRHVVVKIFEEMSWSSTPNKPSSSLKWKIVDTVEYTGLLLAT